MSSSIFCCMAEQPNQLLRSEGSGSLLIKLSCCQALGVGEVMQMSPKVQWPLFSNAQYGGSLSTTNFLRDSPTKYLHFSSSKAVVASF